MSLINCPECGKQISDKSDHCINCGYPLKEQIESNTTDSKFAVVLNNGGENKVKAIRLIREITDCDLFSAKKITEILPSVVVRDLNLKDAENVQKEFSAIGASTEIVSDKKSETIKGVVVCPRCGSNQITTGQRGFSLITGFIGSNKTVNRCAKCGYNWQPR